MQPITPDGLPDGALIPGPPGPVNVTGVTGYINLPISALTISSGCLFWGYSDRWSGPNIALGRRGDVWHVSSDGAGDAPTIKAAIDSACAGDTVLIANGVFYEYDIELSWGLTIMSESGDPDSAVIDAQGLGRIFYCSHLDSGNAGAPTIEGLTLTGGAIEGNGGAIYLEYSSPTIRNCVIKDNTTLGTVADGGGIACRYSSPDIIDCMISGNTAADKGGGIHCHGSSPHIIGSIFAGDSSTTFGGGLFCWYHSFPTVDSCTFYGNSGVEAGGIAVGNNSRPTIVNTIISFSTIGRGVFCDGSSDALIVCSDVYGNAGGDWESCIAVWDSMDGNFCEDPLFCDPGSLDFRLQSGSPCLDAPDCGQVGALGDTCEVSAVSADQGPAQGFQVLASRPNPFSPSTELVFSLREPAIVRLAVHDATGRRIAVLADRRYGPGTHRVKWDGLDSSGRDVAPGTYFCHLKAGDRVANEKIVLIR
jgi:hypothetical protein